jgi:hypothetical protein
LQHPAQKGSHETYRQNKSWTNRRPAAETTVTQITPDDVLTDGGPITPATGDGTPTERQLEQDVVMVNPSVDSMESRG